MLRPAVPVEETPRRTESNVTTPRTALAASRGSARQYRTYCNLYKCIICRTPRAMIIERRPVPSLWSVVPRSSGWDTARRAGARKAGADDSIGAGDSIGVDKDNNTTQEDYPMPADVQVRLPGLGRDV